MCGVHIYGSVSVLFGGGALGSVSGQRGLEVVGKLISVTEHTKSMLDVINQRPVGSSHRRGYEPWLLSGTWEYRSSRFHPHRGGYPGS